MLVFFVFFVSLLYCIVLCSVDEVIGWRQLVFAFVFTFVFVFVFALVFVFVFLILLFYCIVLHCVLLMK